MNEYFKWTVYHLQNFFAFIFGQSDGMLKALVAVVVLDYITGVCVAISRHSLSSKVGARGIMRKLTIFALIALSHIMDEYLLGSSNVLRTVATAFYLSNECISIFENAGELGLPLPEKLKNILKYFDKYSD